MRRALISVSDKTNLADLGRRLVALGYELISTGGTLKTLQQAGVPAVSISEVTGFPEVFGGRVKTLHPLVHGGILFRRGHDEDEATRAELGIDPIDLVVVNLYPFQQTVARREVSLENAIEQIDIGGPTLIRASAKNFAHVGVFVDPSDYDTLLNELESAAGELSLRTRQQLAKKGFEHTARYDIAISGYLTLAFDSESTLPETLHLSVDKKQALRYGENPHQPAALYGNASYPALGGCEVLQGKALSYNNILDLGAALEAVSEFSEPASVIVKHTNPCGVGVHDGELVEAYHRALAGDPVSAFGGIVALNRRCDGELAKCISKRFFEVLVAPELSEEALHILARKRDLRVVRSDRIGPNGPSGMPGRVLPTFRSTVLGVLVQAADLPVETSDETTWRVVTHREPTSDEMKALEFLWRVVKHVKSNAIVVGSSERTFGIGAGQMSRVDSVRLALAKSTGDGAPAVMASDAFFPFRDNIDVAAEGGITAVVQPGGSRGDEEVVEAANEHGMAMVMTGRRHFRH